jgi:hypothetical protein
VKFWCKKWKIRALFIGNVHSSQHDASYRTAMVCCWILKIWPFTSQHDTIHRTAMDYRWFWKIERCSS